MSDCAAIETALEPFKFEQISPGIFFHPLTNEEFDCQFGRGTVSELYTG